MLGKVHRLCVEDKLEQSDTHCFGVREIKNEARPSFTGRFVRILTRQWCELKSRAANNLCGVDLNTMILVDSTVLRIFKTNIHVSMFASLLLWNMKH